MSIRGLTVTDRPPADIGRIRRSNESCIPPDPVSEPLGCRVRRLQRLAIAGGTTRGRVTIGDARVGT